MVNECFLNSHCVFYYKQPYLRRKKYGIILNSRKKGHENQTDLPSSVMFFSCIKSLISLIVNSCAHFSFFLCYPSCGRMHNDVIRPLLYGNSNTLDNFYSSLSDERKICLKRDVPSYPKVTYLHFSRVMRLWYFFSSIDSLLNSFGARTISL